MSSGSASRPARIAYVGVGDGGPCPVVRSFQVGLHDHGYVEGENIAVEYRFARGEPERYRALVAELVALSPDVLVVADSQALPIAHQATTTIPIVMTVSGDPVRDGLVASLERPGGNVTGMTNQARGLNAARLALLQRVVPEARRVAVLWNVGHPGVYDAWERTAADAAALGLEAAPLAIADAAELEAAFDRARDAGADALLVLQDRLTTGARHAIVALAAERQVPGAYG